MWDEVKASNLVKITLDGEIVDDPTGLGFNEAGFVIHSAIHEARRDVNCIMHTHTAAGVGVSAQEHGLLPISQHAMRLTNNVASHAYEELRRTQASRCRYWGQNDPHFNEPWPSYLWQYDSRSV